VRAGRHPVLLGLLLLAGCGGSGDDSRDQVRAYVERANQMEQGATAELQRANDAYVAFARGELRPGEALRKLQRGEDDLRAARDRLEGLRPPQDAKALHAKLQRVYDMNLGLAHETALLAAYQRDSQAALAPLDRANQALRADLDSADGPAAQAGALARFSARLRRSLSTLRSLQPPPVLRVQHADQIARVARTRSLADRLRAALDAQDAEQVATMLQRFRRASRSGASHRGLAKTALRRYERRYEQLNDAYADVYRELTRLDGATR
jgi:hypothetical protein